MAVCNACYPFGGMNQVIDHAGCKSQFCRQMSLADNVRYYRCEGGQRRERRGRLKASGQNTFFYKDLLDF